MLKLPHFLDNWLIDGEVSLAHWLPFTPRKIDRRAVVWLEGLSHWLLKCCQPLPAQLLLVPSPMGLNGNILLPDSSGSLQTPLSPCQAILVQLVLPIKLQHRSHREQCLPLLLSIAVAAGMCLLTRCLAMDISGSTILAFEHRVKYCHMSAESQNCEASRDGCWKLYFLCSQLLQERVFSVWSVQRLYHEDQQDTSPEMAELGKSGGRQSETAAPWWRCRSPHHLKRCIATPRVVRQAPANEDRSHGI
jgi:hypothetical protein